MEAFAPPASAKDRLRENAVTFGQMLPSPQRAAGPLRAKLTVRGVAAEEATTEAQRSDTSPTLSPVLHLVPVKKTPPR